MVKRIAALVSIFVCTTVAWMVVAETIRSHTANDQKPRQSGFSGGADRWLDKL